MQERFSVSVPPVANYRPLFAGAPFRLQNVCRNCRNGVPPRFRITTRYTPSMPSLAIEWNIVLAGAPRTVMDKLQRVLNAAARVITGIKKFDRGLGQILHDQLHLARRRRPGSLQASSDSSAVSERQRTTLSVGALHPGLQCRHAPASAFRQPSSTCPIPRFRLNTYGHRAFSVAGPMAWNSIPDFIRDLTSRTDCFRRLLKTYLLAR